MHITITGGAGFIGCNLAQHYLAQGHTVTVFDNLSRRGSDKNLTWLQDNYGSGLSFIKVMCATILGSSAHWPGRSMSFTWRARSL